MMGTNASGARRTLDPRDESRGATLRGAEKTGKRSDVACRLLADLSDPMDGEWFEPRKSKNTTQNTHGSGKPHCL